MRMKMTREELSWVLYDVGNSAFVLIMVTAIMPIFFKDVAAAGMSPAAQPRYFLGSTLSCLICVRRHV